MELSKKDPQHWAQESFALAKHIGYRDGALAGGADRADGPVLPEEYAKEAEAVAERRVVLAAYRIADVLTVSMKPAP